MSQSSQSTKGLYIGLELGGKSWFFNEIDYKMNCNVTKLISNNFFSTYGYHMIL
jgi:hypothetical protein